MAEVVGFHLNRGVLAAAPRPPELSLAQVLDGARTVAVLEGVNDHENLGSMFRNAAGLSVDAVVFGVGCADPLYRRAVRVSMGHALLVPYAWSATWPGDLDVLRDNGFRVLAMTPNPSAPDAWPRRCDARRRAGGDPGRRRGAGADRAGDAGERRAGADPDVAGYGFAQRRHRRRPGVLRAGQDRPTRLASVTEEPPLGDRADGGGVRRGGDGGRDHGAQPGADPSASAAGGGPQPGRRRRAGADGVGLAHAAGVAVVRPGSGVGVAGAWLALLAMALAALAVGAWSALTARSARPEARPPTRGRAACPYAPSAASARAPAEVPAPAARARGPRSRVGEPAPPIAAGGRSRGR